ncbi:hypothetical protein KO561_03225 [Radiobacillus kanasensis]|uniref:hypothetical protein n=1 Tax=Radiobacillus kanasensis TaxID=2844358 RepID=UPI001E4103DB|nr:hypothetical protein [Radiobacillus kanasensis]UFT99989.1 hypothetical protein KO561_03225 [Radiobacillus kanasensis]
MKSKLTVIFILLSVVVQTLGLFLKFPYKGLLVWGSSFVFLLFAAYFTKYLPND